MGLRHSPRGHKPLAMSGTARRAATATLVALSIVVAALALWKIKAVIARIFFMFAVGAYWIFERDRTIGLVQSLLPRHHRRVTRDTWLLIDDKLGAFVRGELLLIVFVATLLSLAFWLDGEPYWLLIGAAAGVFEIVPIIGPLVIGILAVGVGLTVDWKTALGAGI